jgi:Uma2 family endonuclease
MVIEGLKRRFTVAEYHRMAEAGILGADDRVELIEGEILQMTPIGREHAACVDRLTRLFSERAGQSAQVRIQGPVVLDDSSEPQPDVALLVRRPDFYSSVDPRPDDVILLVEVADTSLDFDTKKKIPLYAQSRIREVWLVDVAAGEVDVHRRPGPDGYADVRRYSSGEELTITSLPSCRVTVAEITGGGEGRAAGAPPRT